MTKDGACVRDDISLTSPELVHLSRRHHGVCQWSGPGHLEFKSLKPTPLAPFRCFGHFDGWGISRHFEARWLWGLFRWRDHGPYRKRGTAAATWSKSKNSKTTEWKNVGKMLHQLWPSTEISRNEWKMLGNVCLTTKFSAFLHWNQGTQQAGSPCLDSDTGYRFAAEALESAGAIWKMGFSAAKSSRKNLGKMYRYKNQPVMYRSSARQLQTIRNISKPLYSQMNNHKRLAWKPLDITTSTEMSKKDMEITVEPNNPEALSHVQVLRSIWKLTLLWRNMTIKQVPSNMFQSSCTFCQVIKTQEFGAR